MLLSETENRTTIACLLTPRGRGAIATIAVQGQLEQLETAAKKLSRAFFVARNRKPIHLQPTRKILFGCWGEEELVLCRTKEDEIEIHCHGGEAAVSRILSDLEKTGVKILDASDYLEQSTGSWEADYQQAILQAKTFQTAELLLRQRQAGVKTWNELEKCLDTTCWSQLDKQDKKARYETIQQMMKWVDFADHLTTPWNIVIGGLANVGKSSLINALLGFERAIVVNRPGTTRDVVTGETALEGWPVLLSDTAGQRKTEDHLETIGIEHAVAAMQKADLQILLLDRSASPDHEAIELMRNFPEALLVFNKTDLPAADGWSRIEFPRSPLEISCQTGAGIEALTKKIIRRLIPQTPPESVTLPVSKRQKQLLHQLISHFNRETAQS